MSPACHHRVVLLFIKTIITYRLMWKYYALLSALFAAFTAIFAKIGIRDISSNLATAIRTTFILLLTWGIVLFRGRLSEIRGD